MLVEIFYQIDEFCKLYEKGLLGNEQKRRGKKSVLLLSEIMTIAIYFSYSGYKNFKEYYINMILQDLKSAFRGQVSYNRFIELLSTAVIPLMLFSKTHNQNNCSGTSFIDSFKLAVCHNKRIYSHRVFKGLAQRGKTSMGWFFGFKVHFVINQQGEILNFYLTPGNVSDSNGNVLDNITKKLFGKLFGDKGYLIGAEKWRELYGRGIQLFTRVRSNMKNKLMRLQDKLLLNKRGVIESVISLLKGSFSIEHSRHRSQKNFVAHLASALAAYAFRKQKPSIKTESLVLPY